MRFTAGSALLLLALAFAPVQAHAGTVGVSFGGFFCRPPIPCDPSDPNYPSADQITALANSCISQKTGYPATDGGFFQGSGLDGNNCLTTNTAAFPSTTAGKVTPHCCVSVTPTSPNVCAIYCSMASSQ